MCIDVYIDIIRIKYIKIQQSKMSQYIYQTFTQHKI